MVFLVFLVFFGIDGGVEGLIDNQKSKIKKGGCEVWWGVFDVRGLSTGFGLGI